MIGMDLWGSDCKQAENFKDQVARICKGVEGYSLLVKGDEVERGLFLTKPEIYLIAPNGRQYPLRYWNTSDPKYEGLHLNGCFHSRRTKRFRCARKTFQEAIRREVKKNGPQADGRLYEIGTAQARMGLLDEAGKTASMIHDPSLRQMVETSIRERSTKPE